MEKMKYEKCKYEADMIPDGTDVWSMCDICEDSDCFEPIEQEQ